METDILRAYVTQSRRIDARRLTIFLAVEVMRVDVAAAVPVSSAQTKSHIEEPLDRVFTTRPGFSWHLAISCSKSHGNLYDG